MERALVIGGTGGIGAAVVAELRMRGVAVETLSRSADGLDLCDEASVRAALGALQAPFDMVFMATGKLDGAGQPPEKALKSVDPAALADQFAVNAIGPLLVLKHAVRLMPRDRRSVFAALSARVGSIGDNRMGGWYAYRMAKAALNQGLHTAAIELARTHRQAICVALHPGTVATPFTAAYAGRHRTVAPDQAAKNLLGVIDGLTPAETGGFFDWAGKRVAW
ncbi:SDR family NAD(P)-dependent oxidoreductase [Rhodovulum adriaticum]|uniref:NAD(P)-dependent dehydrogenase (Short-subunit alcohol dehydrogenase family) n=1 Tax=Rhodovulum adriaticum TaxID=35804 RepID=A0A4R2NK87_RHOAD|nr:SDR family NAD(P)-dependent oxidoreductase [Rhodovulum adriaticum]MBK1634727.1 C factor, cell signaling protein [Rhodovulum adriaticum]TCP21564.1 NAD(P)-dependent dehydrogenase (short-subunit alcohol dehydrogenase family) [Rhodovulum adriaticum]